MTTTRPSPPPPANDFQALLGDASRPGLLPLKERLKAIEKGVNPYVTGDALPGNSPVFFGRDQALHETLSVLRRPDKPGSVSVVAERRMGKSSFIEQLRVALAAEAGLVTVHADPQAYRVSRGQPLVLQSLGATLISQYNTVVFNGGERSDYVSTFDLEQAVRARVEQQGNLAFENHWKDSDPATRKALSALAWATTNRPSLDVHGITAALAEQGLGLERQALFPILERLVEEELLERAGPTYGFAVPLYGRWLRWRWPPRRVVEMG